MTTNTISTLWPIRLGSHFRPLHSPDSAHSPDSLIFFHRKAGTAVDPAARVRDKPGMTDSLATKDRRKHKEIEKRGCSVKIIVFQQENMKE
jgi:hypothetical protein